VVSLKAKIDLKKDIIELMRIKIKNELKKF